MRTATTFESVSPILAVQDLPQALAYYRDVLGFDIAWTWGEPATLAAVCRDRVEITLARRTTEHALGPSHLYLRMTGIDDYHARLQQDGARITVSIDNRAYGLRDFRVVDPDGNILDFGQAVGGTEHG